MREFNRVVTISLLALIVSNGTALAQVVAPSGANALSVGEGTGQLSPVNAAGEYQATLPITLPAGRGAYSVPFSVQYTGSTRAGAAGSGWTVPISTVRRSDSEWHRKPAFRSNSSGDAFVSERILLSLGGASFVMVKSPQPNIYVPFLSDQYMELHEVGGGWYLYLANGLRYQFQHVSAVSEGRLSDPDLSVLTSIKDTINGCDAPGS